MKENYRLNNHGLRSTTSKTYFKPAAHAEVINHHTDLFIGFPF